MVPVSGVLDEACPLNSLLKCDFAVPELAHDPIAGKDSVLQALIELEYRMARRHEPAVLEFVHAVEREVCTGKRNHQEGEYPSGGSSFSEGLQHRL